MAETSKTLILVLIRSLPNKSGGIQKGVFQLYSFLRGKGYNVEFIYNSKSSKVTRFDNFKINHVMFPPVYDFIFSKKYFAFKRNIKKFYQLLDFKKAKYSNIVVVAHWAPDFILLAKFKNKYHFKTIFSFEGPYHLKKYESLSQREYPWLWSINRQLSLIDRFVFISDSLYNAGNRLPKAFKKRAMVIKNGVPLNTDIISKTDSELSIILINRLVSNKNTGLVLKALSILKENQILFRCDIYGDGNDYESLSTYIKINNLSDSVILKGFEEDINSVLNNYNYFISASFFEGMPRSPLEAINQSILPILSDIPMHREILPAGVDLFFDVQDYKALANIIIKIHHKTETEKEEIRHMLKTHILSNFHIDLRFKKFQKLIEQI